MKSLKLALPFAFATALTACGGGGGTPTGTMRLSLTDSPACGYDNVFVTVEKVRVHQSGGADDNDGGWAEVVLPTPQRVDLLTLTNGTLLPLGQAELAAGTYTQMRLVLGNKPPPGSPQGTLANSIKPTGGSETELTTPSGQQSGLKMNVNITVPAGQVADFAIDFDACKSFVKSGASGKYILKPVLTVTPIVSSAAQRVIGYVDPAIAVGSTSISLQQGGVPVKGTVPGANGSFVLYPVPAGMYDLVVTSAGRATAVMTGVPVTTHHCHHGQRAGDGPHATGARTGNTRCDGHRGARDCERARAAGAERRPHHRNPLGRGRRGLGRLRLHAADRSAGTDHLRGQSGGGDPHARPPGIGPVHDRGAVG